MVAVKVTQELEGMESMYYTKTEKKKNTVNDMNIRQTIKWSY